MSAQEAARKQGQWLVVSISPDVCKTPMGSSMPPVPYNVIAKLDQALHESRDVKFNRGKALMLGQGFVAQTLGDQAGSGTSVISGTVGADTWFDEHSQSVRVNGRPVVRHGDLCHMNGNKQEEDKRAKKARYACRKSQIEAGKNSQDPKTQQAANRFEKNNQAIEKANLSENVYDKDKEPPVGWSKATDADLAKMGLKPKDLQLNDSDFRAQVYVPDKEVFGNDMKPTLAFKGTSTMEDWKNNGLQAMDMESPYYRKAVQLGDKLAGSSVPVEITGHSLGGGMASAASVASGKAATTFNAAGLHPNTVGRYGGTPQSSPVQAYRVAGEVLTGAQEPGLKTYGAAAALGGTGGVSAVAALDAMTPKAVGVPHELPATAIDPVRRHFMRDVIAGIEDQKQEDQAKLAQATGVTCPK